MSENIESCQPFCIVQSTTDLFVAECCLPAFNTPISIELFAEDCSIREEIHGYL